ncbi:MAG: 7-carboxy-7-deazaguanine synthase, partial [Calditrichaeota bacterium]
RPAVFCRFSGCNLWSGREEDREKAICRFCDTDFVGTDGPGGGKYENAEALAQVVKERWPSSNGNAVPLVVCTGGEPLLQLDTTLIHAFHQNGFEVAIETNGTLPAPEGIDWVCVSPKAGAELRLVSGDELKLVYPQEGLDPESLLDLDFRYFFIQPMDGPDLERNIRLSLEYCLKHPRWRLSLQTHKFLQIP